MMNLTDTPAGAIARLDDALSRRGQSVTLRRGNSTTGQVTVKALVRGVKAEQVVGEVTQTDRKVVLSPSGLGAFGEPDASVMVVIDGKPSKIVGKPEPIRLNDVLVRINMVVKG